MKKLLTLFTLLLLVCSGAFGQGKVVKIFHWQTNATAPELDNAMSSTKGGLPSVGTAVWKGDAAPGTEGVTYNAAVTDSEMKGSTGKKALKLNKSNLSMKVSLLGDVKLQAGDVISICGYNPFNIGTTESATHKAGTEIASAQATGTDKTDYNVGTVTVTAAMIASVGSGINALYFSRSEGSGTGLAAIKITRTITAPLITTQPISADYKKGESSSALTVAAIASDGDLTYQWYKNTDGDTSAKEEDKIEGANGATLDAAKISTATADTYYYYCVVGDGGANKTPSEKAVINVIETYTVTYKANGSGEEDIVDNNASTVVANTFVYSGHKFTGWNTESDGSGTPYIEGAAVSEDLTLYAQWADKYTITVRPTTNGTITASATEAAAGEEITLTATPDFRYVRGSWMVYKTGDATNTTYVDANNKFIMPAYNVTVDAIFTADSRKQILYLRKTANENDDLYNSLKNNDDYVVTYEAPGTQTVTDYDLVVLHESLDGSLAESEGLIKSIATADVPILNTKSYFYNSSRWNWGTPDAGKSVKGATINRAYANTASHPIFNDVTIEDNFIEVVSEAASKAMQPVDPVSGKEGYLLATTPKGDGTALTAIHELTPAQRGAKSGKYLLISVSNAKLDDLSANGLKLFNNAVSYLLSNDQWVPTATVTIAEACTDGEGKYYGTYSNASAFVVPADLTVSAVGVSDGKLVVTNYDEGDVVKANTGVMVSATSAGNKTITLSTETGTEKDGNLLKASGNDGIEDAEAMETAAPGCKYYRLTMHNTTDLGFYYGAENGAAFALAANKAYLAVPESLAKEGFSFITGEEETDGIKAVTTAVENGVRYNLAGQKVGADYKGIVIVNGKKYLNK